MTADVYATVAEALAGCDVEGDTPGEVLLSFARAVVDALAGMGDVTDEEIGDAVSWDFAGKVAAVRALIAQARATDQARIAELEAHLDVARNARPKSDRMAGQYRRERDEARATVERVRALFPESADHYNLDDYGPGVSTMSNAYARSVVRAALADPKGES
jgi:hypothetical protein